MSVKQGADENYRRSAHDNRKVATTAHFNRLMTKSEAAKYCRLSAPTFHRLCPVRPVDLGSGNPRLLRYDVRDLDKWIDELKNKVGTETTHLEPDAYLARLDQ